MIENKEFQSILKKYPDDLSVAIAITHDKVTSLFYNNPVADEHAKGVLS